MKTASAPFGWGIVVFLFILFAVGTGIAGCGSDPARPISAPPTDKTYSEPDMSEIPEIPWSMEYGGNVSEAPSTETETAVWEEMSPSVHCTRDDRLTIAARHHAAALVMSRKADVSDLDQLRFTLRKLGSYDYKINSINGTVGEGPIASGASAFLQAVRNADEEWTHCGLGVAAAGGRKLAVWIGVNRTLEIDPFPVKVAVGTLATLSVHTDKAYQSSIHLYVGQPDTSVIEIESSLRNRDGSRKFEIPVTSAGRIEVELLQDTGNGPETVMLVPIFAEIQPDTRPRIFVQADRAAESDPEQELFRLLNIARKKIGLPPLVRDGRLDEVALKHSEDMEMNGFFGHVSPIFGALSRRLAVFHLSPAHVGENIASGATSFRIHHKLMESPAHRINMLNPGFSRVGIGTAKKDATILATEIYATW